MMSPQVLAICDTPNDVFIVSLPVGEHEHEKRQQAYRLSPWIKGPVFL